MKTLKQVKNFIQQNYDLAYVHRANAGSPVLISHYEEILDRYKSILDYIDSEEQPA
jgi:hypothetical protein